MVPHLVQGSYRKILLKFTTFLQTLGMQLFCTSAKGAQPLLQLMASALYSSKLTGSAFFVILHGHVCLFFKLLFGLGKCSFWLTHWEFFPSALRTTNFHRPHSVFTDFQGLEKLIPFSTNFHFRVQELCESRGGRPGLSVLTSLMVSVDWRKAILNHVHALVSACP